MHAPSQLTDRSTTLDAGSFQRIATLAEREAGLAIPEAKRSMVQSRLNRRLRATGINGFEAYLDHVESKDGSEERAQMISALTTNVSHFFREDHHFVTLRERVLPQILANKRRKIRIWSAGCSTGQEPYSIAMTLIDALPEISKFDIRILASDIDRKVLSAAQAGIYQDRELESLPRALRESSFERCEEGFRIREHVRRLVTFRRLNLIENWPMSGPFDAVFCRNVLIYFSEETQSALWPRFARILGTDGTLFLGHSERMQKPGDMGFRMGGVTTYVKTPPSR